VPSVRLSGLDDDMVGSIFLFFSRTGSLSTKDGRRDGFKEDKKLRERGGKAREI
jgi:hypothetical protein